MVAAGSLEEAHSIYLRELKYSADKCAPLKVIQMRKYYLPALSTATKELLAERNRVTSVVKSGMAATPWET